LRRRSEQPDAEENLDSELEESADGKTKPTPDERMASSVKVVAGARNHLNMLFNAHHLEMQKIDGSFR